MVRIKVAIVCALSMACVDAPPVSAPLPFEPRLGKSGTTNPTATVLIPLNDGSLNVRSDYLFSDGANSVYADGVCGLTAPIFLSGSGDMVMNTANPRNADQGCSVYPRHLSVIYPDGLADSGGIVMAVSALENSNFTIPVGSSALRHFHVQTSSTRCDGVHWGGPGGGDSVLVARTAVDTWHVTSQPYPLDQPKCKTVSGRTTSWSSLGHMTVDFWIKSSRDLP